jgi:soluble lytic murein transglycosylase
MRLLYPQAFGAEIADAAARWGVSEELLFGLIRTESVFIPDIVSRAGAVGLAQLMRPTAEDVVARIKGKIELKYIDGAVDLTDPFTNVHLGGWYFANLEERLESPLLALFSYNGGITRVRRWRAAEPALPEDLFLETVPIAETRDYGRKVLAAAAVYGYLYRGKPLSGIVADFFPTSSHFGFGPDR